MTPGSLPHGGRRPGTSWAAGRARAAALAGLSGALAACEGDHSALSPAGPKAALIADLTWLLTAFAGLAFAIVIVLLLIALVRSRSLPRTRQPVAAGDDRSSVGRRLVILGGIALPLVLLPATWFVSLPAMRSLAEPERPPTLEIDVTARMWSYDVEYPTLGRRLVDEIRVPVGEPVLLRLTSVDVIHSFWVPRLSGKQDMIPGAVHELWIQADEPGVFGGRCAEFCGIGHARMEIRVVAEERAAFDAWAAGG